MYGIDNATIAASCPYLEAILKLFASLSHKKMEFMSLENNFSVIAAQNSAKSQAGRDFFLSFGLEKLT